MFEELSLDFFENVVIADPRKLGFSIYDNTFINETWNKCLVACLNDICYFISAN